MSLAPVLVLLDGALLPEERVCAAWTVTVTTLVPVGVLKVDAPVVEEHALVPRIKPSESRTAAARGSRRMELSRVMRLRRKRRLSPKIPLIHQTVELAVGTNGGTLVLMTMLVVVKGWGWPGVLA